MPTVFKKSLITSKRMKCVKVAAAIFDTSSIAAPSYLTPATKTRQLYFLISLFD
jgi:hypothetical protein